MSVARHIFLLYFYCCFSYEDTGVLKLLNKMYFIVYDLLLALISHVSKVITRVRNMGPK